MRAIVHDANAPDARAFRAAFPKPVVAAADSSKLLVKVHAAALNPVDYKLPMFVVGGKAVGFDFAGVVAQSASPLFAVGDAVFGNCQGAQAEFVECAPGDVTRKPAHLSFVQAAALPTAYLTSLQALRRGSLQAGGSVLVIGASGGCGAAGVQLARAMGAAEVVGVCSQRNEAMVAGLGAHSTIDYTKGSIASALPADKRFDMVYDTVTAQTGDDYTDVALSLCKDNAKLVVINGSSWTWTKYFLGLQTLCNSQKSLLLTEHATADLDAILACMAGTHAGGGPGFEPLIDSVHAFDEAGMKSAYERLKSNRARGKVVLDLEAAAAPVAAEPQVPASAI